MYDRCCKCFRVFIGLFLGVLVYFCIPSEVNAETTSFSGTIELKMATGNATDGLISGNAVYPNFITQTYPNSAYMIIPGSDSTNYSSYYFVKWFDLQVIANDSFQVGKTYALTFNLDYGSYITFSNFYGWDLTADRNLTECDSMSINDLSTCSISWNPQNDTTSSQMVIVFRPNITSNQVAFVVGDKRPNNHFAFWNRLGQGQGFKISSISITTTQNSGNNPSQDFTAVLEEQQRTTAAVEENTQAVEDLHNDLIDNSFDDTEAENLFGDIDFFEDNTLSGIITSPINFIRSLNSTCQPITLTAFHKSFDIPCGTTLFWNREDVSTFKTFWNILFGGLIIYRLLFKLFKVVNDVLDPTKDTLGGVEV